jgi:hypothetical protein
VAELMKTCFNRGEKPALYFWRDSTGNEVDVILEQGTRLIPIEIKSGRTLTRDSFAGLEKWMRLAGESAARPTLVYGGDENYRHKEIEVFAWRDVEKVFG